MFRDLGRAVGNILRPDGNPILSAATNLGLPTGSVSRITDAVQSLATVNPARVLDQVASTGLTSVLSSFGIAQPPAGGPPYENVLEQFASYTPLWTMACLEPDQFNNPKRYRGNPGALKNIVFSSAGRFDAQRATTINGSPEYFVDNFNMPAKIAPGPKTGNTNVTSFTFEVYEPYSMGLFLQSLQSAAIQAGYPSYLNDTPYLLKLEFMGFKDNGAIFTGTESLAKYFTIKIKDVKMRVDEGGSKYVVNAVPFPHLGFSDLANKIPNETVISGEDVKEILVSGERSLCTVLNELQLRLVGQDRDVPDLYEVVFPIDYADEIGLNPYEDVELLKATADPNEQKRQPIEGRKGQRSTNFGDGEIGVSSMGFGPESGGNYLFKLEGDVFDEATGRIVRDQVTIDPKQRTFTFPQGDRVTEIIQRIVCASKYGVSALDENNWIDGRIKWFRIDVQIQLLDFDQKRNVRAKKFTYRVIPYLVHHSIFKNPSAPSSGLPAIEKIIAKRYNYIYSGQNNDLLKFELNFDGMFYTGALPSPPQQNAAVSNTDTQASAETPQNGAVIDEGAAPEGVASETGASMVKPDYDIPLASASGAKTVEQVVADSFQHAFLNNSSKDVVNIKIDILGDPYYISDSGINANYIAQYGPNDQITADGSMNYEGGEVYCYITFRTPIEPNLGTTGQGGLYNFPNGGSVSPFSGIYKITGVTSKFSGGVFTQELECVRFMQQPTDFAGQATIAKQNQLLYNTNVPQPRKQSPVDDPTTPDDLADWYG